MAFASRYILIKIGEIDQTPETKNILRLISFKSGKRPDGVNEISSLFEHLIKKETSAELITGKKNVADCWVCGHNFDNHNLLCNLKDDKTTPTEGWIICPEKDCDCFQTWGANYKATN